IKLVFSNFPKTSQYGIAAARLIFCSSWKNSNQANLGNLEEQMGERNSYRAAAGIFYLIVSLLLSFGSPRTAAAISFTNFNGPGGTCNVGNPPGFCQDIGIDYSPLTGNLVTSVNFGQAGQLDLADVDRFSGIHTFIKNGPVGAMDEL